MWGDSIDIYKKTTSKRGRKRYWKRNTRCLWQRLAWRFLPWVKRSQPDTCWQQLAPYKNTSGKLACSNTKKAPTSALGVLVWRALNSTTHSPSGAKRRKRRAKERGKGGGEGERGERNKIATLQIADPRRLPRLFRIANRVSISRSATQIVSIRAANRRKKENNIKVRNGGYALLLTHNIKRLKPKQKQNVKS